MLRLVFVITLFLVACASPEEKRVRELLSKDSALTPQETSELFELEKYVIVSSFYQIEAPKKIEASLDSMDVDQLSAVILELTSPHHYRSALRREVVDGAVSRFSGRIIEDWKTVSSDILFETYDQAFMLLVQTFRTRPDLLLVVTNTVEVAAEASGQRAEQMESRGANRKLISMAYTEAANLHVLAGLCLSILDSLEKTRDQLQGGPYEQRI